MMAYEGEFFLIIYLAVLAALITIYLVIRAEFDLGKRFKRE